MVAPVTFRMLCWSILVIFRRLRRVRRRRQPPVNLFERVGFWGVDDETNECLLRVYRRRKQQQTLRFITLLTRIISGNRVARTVWTREWSEHWWLYIVRETFNPQQWIENFRMSYRTFQWLCESLRPYISKAETRMRRPIPVEQKVGAVLWFLGTTSDYRTIAHLFGISRASLCIFVKDVCEAICYHLTPQFVKLPTDIEATNIMESFKEKWGYPICIGAIDGSHIPIVAPNERRVDYFNRKGWYSINMQALVDDRYMFRDICVGWSGSTHDARVLVNSQLYQFWENGVFPHLQTEIDGVMVPPVILGDPAYPLLPWLTKPYPENAGTTEAQKKYNFIHSRSRIVVENAFGRLKGRWRRLLKRIDNNTSNVPNVIAACCTLHNICETQGEDFLDQWANEANQPPSNNVVDGENYPDIDNAHDIRNALCRYFANQN
ncbi:putative nuclease HARBI1 [Fundulus heteroclitus]|uniref:putative nuclease HARBI1 n=1 Tax=Fundulus heteroclitus TaxID=8078 RepID=UPI00165BCF61|nr:putative nuclease HARBI1 [Fundulus heteroclitus]